MKTILTPIDFSDVSDAVVNEAARLARALDGRVILLTVIQPPAPIGEYAPLMADIAEFTTTGAKSASQRLGRIETRLRAEGVPTDRVHFIGAPVFHIVEQAEQRGADYIVIGSHGHTALYDLLVGSTTHGVLMRAKCPVVVIPAAKKAKAAKPQSKREQPAVA